MAGQNAIDFLYRVIDRYSEPLNRMKSAAGSFSASAGNAFKRLGKDTEAYQARIQRLGTFMKRGLVIGAGAAVAGIGVLAHKSTQLWAAQSEAIANVDATLKSTGGTVGRTLSQIEAQAASLQSKTFFGDEAIMKGVSAQLLTFTNITEGAFDRTQSVVLDVTAKLRGLNASETDLQSTSIMLGKALNDPVANLGALGRAGIQFSDQQKEMIKGMWNAGNQAGAQSMILAELEKQYGGTAAALASTTEGISMSIKNTQGDMLELIGKGIDPFRKTILQAKADTLNSLLPIIERFNNWTEANEDLINTKITSFLDGAKSAFIGLKDGVILAYNIISKVVEVLRFLSPILIPLIVAIGAYQAVMYTAAAAIMAYNGVQAVMNALMTANPIGLVIAGIAALIAIIVLAVKHWDKIKEVAAAAWDFIVEKTMGAVDAIKGFLLNLWGGFSQLLDNPFFTAAATLLAPWITIPALIIKHWQPLMDFFSMLGDKIGAGAEKVKNFFGGVGDKIGGLFGRNSEATSPYISSTPSAPIPTGYGLNATADATVKVFAESGIGVKPFEASGNLGYNMQTEYKR